MLLALNPFYAMGVLYLTLGALVTLTMGLANLGVASALAGLTWLRVHTIVLGGITQIAFGTLPGYVAARVGASEPSRASQWRLWALLNLGIVLVMLGMVSGRWYVFVTGTLLALSAAAYLVALLWRLGSQGRAGDRPVARFYALGVAYLSLGIVMALTMMLGWPPAPGGALGAREAHIHANAWGFLNLVIAVSLADRLPQIVGRRVTYPGLSRLIWWALAVGAFFLILGPWAAVSNLTLLGVAFYGMGVLLLYVNLLATVRGARPQSPTAGWHLVAAYFWLALPAALAPLVILLGPEVMPVARIELVAVQSLIVGWALQVAMAALPGVLPRLQSGQEPEGCDSPGHRLAQWAALVLLNVGAALFWVAGLGVPTAQYGSVLGTGYLLVFLAWIPFLGRLWRSFTRSAQGVAAPGGAAPGAGQ